jgi:hypothetical protein
MINKRWQDQIRTMLGLWLLVSPWVLDFTGDRMLTLGMPTVPVWTALFFGSVAVLLSVLAIYWHKAWEEAVACGVGVGLLLSPWVLRFADQSVPATNAMLAGAAMLATSIWAAMGDPEVRRWLSEHHLVR